MPPQPTDKIVTGIAKEATYGTYVAPTDFLPVDKFDPKRVIVQLEDKGRRGSAVARYGQVQGVWRSEVDISGDVRPDTIPWHFAAILGDVVTSGASAPFSHVMSVKNDADMQPKSYSFTDQYGVGVRGIPGAKCSELQLKFNADGKFTYEAKYTGRADATQSAPTPAFSAIDLWEAWRCVPTIGGASVDLLEASVNLKRELDPVNVANNSQDPLAVFLGSLDVEGSVTLVMNDETYYTAFINNTQAALVLDFQRGAGANLVQTKLQMTKIAYKDGVKTDRGSMYTKVVLPFNAIANATDVGASGGYSPIKVTCQNAKPSGTFA